MDLDKLLTSAQKFHSAYSLIDGMIITINVANKCDGGPYPRQIINMHHYTW